MSREVTRETKFGAGLRSALDVGQSFQHVKVQCADSIDSPVLVVTWLQTGSSPWRGPNAMFSPSSACSRCSLTSTASPRSGQLAVVLTHRYSPVMVSLSFNSRVNSRATFPPVLPPFPFITAVLVMSPCLHLYLGHALVEGEDDDDDTRSLASMPPCRRTRLRCRPCGPCPLRRPRAVGHPPFRYPYPFPRPHHLCPLSRLCHYCPRHRNPTLLALTFVYSVAVALFPRSLHALRWHWCCPKCPSETEDRRVRLRAGGRQDHRVACERRAVPIW